MSAPIKTKAEQELQLQLEPESQPQPHPEAVAATADEPSTSNQPPQQSPQQPPHGAAAAISPRRCDSSPAVQAATATTEQTTLPQSSPLMRIKRELSEITQHPPPNCSAETHKGDLFHWRASINGPTGTVYEGGVFKLDIRFPNAYPFRPPQIRFVTRIYHCNVDSRGVICLDVLDERWSPVMNISKVLLSIWVLIGECNPNDPLVMAIANQYNFNRKEHDKMARLWTKRYAVPKPKTESETEQTDEQQQQQQAADELSLDESTSGETTVEEQAKENAP